MDGILFWLGAGAAGLLCIALIVAWWEHLGRSMPTPETELPASTRTLSVDVDLDNIPESDVAQRREVMGAVMERMTQPGSLQEAARRRWTDTSPMVGPGPAVVRAPASSRET